MGWKILVVDDHPIVRQGLRSLFAGETEFELVGEAATGAEAVTAVDDTRPDLVIVEVALPDRGGLELIKELTSRSRPPRVMVLSSLDEQLFAGRALDAGAAAYLEKRAPVAEILTAARKALCGEIHLSQPMTQHLLRVAAEGEPAEAATVVGTLTDREIEVFTLLGKGLTTREIAERLGRSVKTVETHRERIKGKLGLENHNELIRRAVEWSLREALE